MSRTRQVTGALTRAVWITLIFILLQSQYIGARVDTLVVHLLFIIIVEFLEAG